MVFIYSGFFPDSSLGANECRVNPSVAERIANMFFYFVARYFAPGSEFRRAAGNGRPASFCRRASLPELRRASAGSVAGA